MPPRLKHKHLKRYYASQDFKNPRDRRLAHEHLSLVEVCEKSDKLDYEITARRGRLPEVYRITYNLKSIVGIDDDQKPIYANRHVAEIRLPIEYPTQRAECYMLTDAWHPNIKWAGNYKGRICVNAKVFGKLYGLGELVVRIAELLQYQNYHAQDIPPYPEDTQVAKWVREYAEPNDIINLSKGIALDETPLFNQEETGTKRRILKIKKIRQANENNLDISAKSVNQRRIKIKKRG